MERRLTDHDPDDMICGCDDCVALRNVQFMLAVIDKAKQNGW